MAKTIRIGTRDSELALWQAKTVQNQLEDLGYQTILVPVKSTGDLILDKPLYELGITGVFTKTLDIAMLNDTIDIAVHSMKDVPTQLPKGIVEAAILPRADVNDILVHDHKSLSNDHTVIATGSLRRKAQWLHKYPNHTTVDLRGNVNTRLQKLKNNDWGGAIFAAAGLERINLTPEHFTVLDWMVPAPAQGAMLVVAKEKDQYCLDALRTLNNKETEICVHVERDFLRELEGGCTAPIGALATIKKNTLSFEGVLFSLDGVTKIGIEREIPVANHDGFGKACAQEILTNGGRALMKHIKAELK